MVTARLLWMTSVIVDDRCRAPHNPTDVIGSPETGTKLRDSIGGSKDRSSWIWQRRAKERRSGALDCPSVLGICLYNMNHGSKNENETRVGLAMRPSMGLLVGTVDGKVDGTDYVGLLVRLMIMATEGCNFLGDEPLCASCKSCYWRLKRRPHRRAAQSFKR